MTIYYQNTFDCKKTRNSESSVQRFNKLFLWALDVILTLNLANQCFRMTLRLMLKHQHADFDHEKLRCLQYIVGINMLGHF